MNLGGVSIWSEGISFLFHFTRRETGNTFITLHFRSIVKVSFGKTYDKEQQGYVHQPLSFILLNSFTFIIKAIARLYTNFANLNLSYEYYTRALE